MHIDVAIVSWVDYYLTNDLGVDKSSIPTWPGTDCDTIYVLQFDANASLLSFRVSAENVTRI